MVMLAGIGTWYGKIIKVNNGNGARSMRCWPYRASARSTIDRLSEGVSEKFLGNHRRSIGYGQQDQKLKDQDWLDGSQSDIPRLTLVGRSRAYS